MKILIAILLISSSPAMALQLLTKAEQGALLYGKTDTANRIFYNGKEIPVTKHGRFVIAIDRDAPKKIEITEKKWYGISTDHKIRVEKRKWDIQRINGMAPEKVNPPKSELARIEKEFAMARSVRQQTTIDDFPGCFIVPIDRVRITSIFGSQRILNGEAKNYHGGIDYAAPTGTKIKATEKGTVVLAHDDMYYSGKTIIIDHGYGVFSSYLHLSRIMVKVGDTVRKGENIGMVGSTGRSTGPHLHFGIDWHGVRVDPQTAISRSLCN